MIKGVDKEEFYEKFLPYAAIATVCDVMPLTNENRVIVSEGIKILRKSKDLGLNALIEAADIKKMILMFTILVLSLDQLLIPVEGLNLLKKP